MVKFTPRPLFPRKSSSWRQGCLGPSPCMDATSGVRVPDLLPRRLVSIPTELTQLTCKDVIRLNVAKCWYQSEILCFK